MTMLEALKLLKTDALLRARPVSWKGQRMAYTLCVTGGSTQLTGETGNGKWASHVGMTSLLSEILEPWEVVSVQEVENE